MEEKVKATFEGPVPAEILKPAGLTDKDVELSIRLARSLSEAVRRDCAKDETLVTEEQKKAERERVLPVAALFLAQRMKPKKR